MNAAILLPLLINGFLAANVGSTGETPAIDGTSGCLCAIFKDGETERTNKEPIISNTNGTFTVHCTADGTGNRECQETCIMLARAVKIRGADPLCEIVGTDTNGFKPALYYKSCDRTTWEYTGHTCPVAICCVEGKQVPCTTTTNHQVSNTTARPNRSIHLPGLRTKQRLNKYLL